MPLTDEQLHARDAARDIGNELLEAVRHVKAGRIGAIREVHATLAVEARTRVGMSQTEFAEKLGVSKRTLQEWEQGRRQPSGAAKALLRIAASRPEIVHEALA